MWSLIADGTITNYTPHTVTIDTHNRKNTVIGKNDITISTETANVQEPKQTNPPAQKTEEHKLRLINFVACRTVWENNRNKRKIHKFCLEEQTKKRNTEAVAQGTRSSATRRIVKRRASTSASHSTPVDLPGPCKAPRSISPIKQTTRKHPTSKSKKKATKKSQPKRKGKSSTQATAKKKLMKAKPATLKQSQAFADNSRGKLNISKISSPQTKEDQSQGHNAQHQRPYYTNVLLASGFYERPDASSQPDHPDNRS